MMNLTLTDRKWLWLDNTRVTRDLAVDVTAQPVPRARGVVWTIEKGKWVCPVCHRRTPVGKEPARHDPGCSEVGSTIVAHRHLS